MIAVIDSGSGGANVIKECLKHYNYDFVYLVDNKNCPYGDKPAKLVKEIVLKNIKILLKKFDIDFIILGCNTASSLIGYVELEQIKCPILKTLPDFKSIIKQKGEKLIFATKSTIKNSNYVKFYMFNYKDIKTLYIKELPKHIDNYLSNKTNENYEKLQKIIKNDVFFSKKLKKYYKKVKNIALGCTHFKYIENNINQIFNNDIKFFYCEKEVACVSKMLIKKQKKKSSIKILLTKPDEKLKSTIIQILNKS